MKHLLAASLLLAFGVALADAQPKLIRVPQDQPTVQAGIDAALDGDTVLVAEGTYSVNLVLAKRIVLGSEYVLDGDTSHISQTILDGGTPAVADSASVIRIGAGTDTTTVVAGFTIRNGKGTIGFEPYNSSTYIGGGGIIFLPGAGARISHNVITGNNVSSSTRGVGGGGIVISTAGPVGFWIIEHNQIVGNTAMSPIGAEGGGGWLTQAGRFEHNVVSGNQVVSSGGTTSAGIGWGASVGSGAKSVTFASNLIRGNVGAAGLTVYAIPPGNDYPICTVTNNIIANNTRAIGVISGQYMIVNNTITGNGDNAAILLGNSRGPLAFSLLNNIIWNPSAAREFDNPARVAGSYNDCREAIAGGTGNISSDPLFLSNHTDSLGWFRYDSPCANAGADSATVGGVLLMAPGNDYYGHGRPVGDKPDIGAFEDGPWSGIGDIGGVIPAAFALEQNYPNPFNPATVVGYELPVAAHVKLVVYDLLGREVAVLANEQKAPGAYKARFDAFGLASGVYIYRLTAGDFVQTRKMTLVK